MVAPAPATKLLGNLASIQSELGLGGLAYVAPNAVALTGGTIDGTVLGSIVPAPATVTNLNVTATAVMASASIYGGTIQATTIGSVTPASAAFTTLSANGNANVGGTLAVAGAISGNVSNATVLATGSTTPRSCGARAADAVNVLDYGADPTGTNDSSPAISAAIASLPNGGRVNIPAGTFRIATILYVLANNIQLEGAGMGATVLIGDLGLGTVIQQGDNNHMVVNNTIENLTVSRAPGTPPSSSIGICWYYYNYAVERNTISINHYYCRYNGRYSSDTCIHYSADHIYAYNSNYCYHGFNHAADIFLSGIEFGRNKGGLYQAPGQSVSGFELYDPVCCFEMSGNAQSFRLFNSLCIPRGPTSNNGIFMLATAWNDVNGIVEIVGSYSENIKYTFQALDGVGNGNFSELKFIGGCFQAALDTFNVAADLSTYGITLAAGFVNTVGPTTLPSARGGRVTGCFLKSLAVNGNAAQGDNWSISGNTINNAASISGSFQQSVFDGNSLGQNAASSVSTTATAASTTNVISVASTTNVLTGMFVIGAGVPISTSVLSTTSTSITLSKVVNVASGAALTIATYSNTTSTPNTVQTRANIAPDGPIADFNSLTISGSNAVINLPSTGNFRFYNNGGAHIEADSGVGLYLNTVTAANTTVGGALSVTGSVALANSLAVAAPAAAVGSANFTARLTTPGVANSEYSDLAFRSTFQSGTDFGPRRSADIWTGFSSGGWGSEFLSFGVGNNGSANDVAYQTIEQMRITGSYVSVFNKLIVGSTISVFDNGNAHIESTDTLWLNGLSANSVNLATGGGTLTVSKTGSTVLINGTTSLASTLAVAGAASLQSTLTVTSGTSLQSTLAVTGAASLLSTLTVAGATVVNSTFYVGSTFSVFDNGNAHIESTDTLWINGNSANNLNLATGGGSLTMSKAGSSALINGNLTVSGTTAINNAFTANAGTANISNPAGTTRLLGFLSSGAPRWAMGASAFSEAATATLSTSAAQSAVGTTLSFSSTSGVVVGQYVYGTSIPAGATVASIVANTSVTLSVATTAIVASGASIQFCTNVGSNFVLYPCNDFGVSTGNILTIYRNTGAMTIANALTVGGGAVLTGSNAGNQTGIGGGLWLNTANAGIEIGQTSGSNTPYVDFHSSGNANDYDARIIASGGTSGNGAGSLSIMSGALSVSGLATFSNGLVFGGGINGLGTSNAFAIAPEPNATATAHVNMWGSTSPNPGLLQLYGATIQVNGATAFASTLSVTGATTLSGGLTVTGNIVGPSPSNAFTIAPEPLGTAQAYVQAYGSSASSNAGWLALVGTVVRIAGPISATAAASLGSTLAVTGATTLSSTLTASGLVTSASGFAATGSTNNCALQWNQPNLAIRDTTSSGSTMYFDVGLGGSGTNAFVWRSTSSVTQWLTLNSGGLNVTSALTVSGATTLGSTLSVGGTITGYGSSSSGTPAISIGTSNSSYAGNSLTIYNDGNAHIELIQGSKTNNNLYINQNTSGTVGINGGGGNTLIGGALAVSKTISTTANPTTAWNLDGVGSQIGIGTNSSVNLPAGEGLLLLTDTNGAIGSTAVYLIGGQSVALLGASLANDFVVGTPSANRIGVAWNSSSSCYTIYNGYSSQGVTLGAVLIRTGTGN